MAAIRYEPIPLPNYSCLWGLWDHKRRRMLRLQRQDVWWTERERAQQAADILNGEGAR